MELEQAAIINAGLPWTNPLKLQIGSDEHILDTTINRGLMMLLNNDYYLDLSNNTIVDALSSIINNNNILYNAIENHLNDENMHYQNVIKTEEINNENYSFNNNIYIGGKKEESLNEDTIKYIPISYNSVQIQKIIDETPHNLNKFTLVFLFVVDKNYKDENKKYELNLGDSCIKFNNFFNGNVIIMGDWLHKNRNFHSFNDTVPSVKTSDQIIKPEQNVHIFLAKYYNELNNPENINSIITYEKYLNEDNENKTNILEEEKLNKITILGSGLNDEYCVVSISDNTADVQVKNLKFESILKPNTLKKDEIDLSSYRKEMRLPCKEKVLLFYPFEKDLNPIVNDQFSSIIKKDETEIILKNLSGYLNDEDGANIIIDDIHNNLTNLYDEFKSEATKNKLNDFNDNSLINNFKFGLDSSFKKIIENIKLLKNIEPKCNYNDYFDESINLFLYDKLINDLNGFNDEAGSFIIKINSFLKSINLYEFIRIRPDLADKLPDDEITDSEIKNYLDSLFNDDIKKLSKKIVEISNNILFYIENNIKNFNSSVLGFNESYSEKINPTFVLSGDFSDYDKKNIKFGNNSKNCSSFKLLNKNGENQYLYIEDSNFSKYIGNVLFKKNIYKNLNENNEDASICIWTKTNILDYSLKDLGFFGFKINGNTFNFVINPSDVTCVKKDDDNDNHINFIKTSDVYNIHNNDWILWEFKITHYNNENKISVLGRIHHRLLVEKLGKYEYEYHYIDLKNIEDDDKICSPVENDGEIKNFEMCLGYNFDGKTTKYFDGYIRNLMIFAGHLNNIESESLFNAGIQSLYGFKPQIVNTSNNDLFKKDTFFIGLLGSYNNTNINILNCVVKHNCKSYII